MQLAGQADDPRSRGIRHSGGFPDEREKSIDEKEMAEVVDSHVSIDTVRGQGKRVHTHASISDELECPVTIIE
jgi:hypothetical protein